MSVSPAEAAKRWCPFARVGIIQELDKGIASAALNRDIDGKPDPGSLCIGPRCMAWQTDHPSGRKLVYADDDLAQTEPPRPATVPASWTFEPADVSEGEAAAWLEPFADAEARSRGHCGLVQQVRP